MEGASAVVVKAKPSDSRRIQVAFFSYHVAKSVRLMSLISTYMSVSVKEAVTRPQPSRK